MAALEIGSIGAGGLEIIEMDSVFEDAAFH
jgi:hypothetical protein